MKILGKEPCLGGVVSIGIEKVKAWLGVGLSIVSIEILVGCIQKLMLPPTSKIQVCTRE